LAERSEVGSVAQSGKVSTAMRLVTGVRVWRAVRV
jgi:hypothetical protein